MSLYGNYDLLFYIDETGDEYLKDNNNPVFCLGGCGVFAPYANNDIRERWKTVRKVFSGDCNKSIHASECERRLSVKKENVLIDYFLRGNFFRIGSLTTRATALNIKTDDFDSFIVEKVFGIMDGILTLSQQYPFHKLYVIFESSSRLDSKIKKAAQLVTHDGGDKKIPVEWRFVPKSSGEIGLEVADFMMHSAAGYYRNKDNENNKFKKRFQAIFPESQNHLSHFSETLGIETK